MANLEHEHQVFIVVSLARFKTPQEVADAVKEEFGLEIGRQQVRHYNPAQSPTLAKMWVSLFKKERKKFLESPEALGIFHKAYRLSRLEEMFDHARKTRNFKFAARLLEQAAKESGDAFSNVVKSEVTGKDGGAVSLVVTPVEADYRNAAAALAPKEEK